MADNSTFPTSSVEPNLFDENTKCNMAMPGGEVIEWFDFGQCVELIAVDASGVSHPVVLTNEKELARTAGAIGDDVDLPTRAVDVLGGIPIEALADQSHGHGKTALEPLKSAT